MIIRMSCEHTSQRSKRGEEREREAERERESHLDSWLLAVIPALVTYPDYGCPPTNPVNPLFSSH